MDRPKYSIGDLFTLSKSVESEGLTFKSSFKFVVIGVKASGGSKGAEYTYTLARDFPQAYWEPPNSFYERETVLDSAGKIGSVYG